MFNFAAERGIIEDSPCTRIRKATEKGRDRVLSDEEIKLLWAALDLGNKEVDMYHLSKLAMKMILLTGQRPGEVTGAAWDEIKDNFWNIPKERMKNGEAQQVPLSGMALEILEQAKPYSSGPYVFISPQSPRYNRKKPSKARNPKEHDAPMTSHALSRALVRHWKEMGFKEDAERFTPHDLRRTVRTKLAALGVNDCSCRESPRSQTPGRTVHLQPASLHPRKAASSRTVGAGAAAHNRYRARLKQCCAIQKKVYLRCIMKKKLPSIPKLRIAGSEREFVTLCGQCDKIFINTISIME